MKAFFLVNRISGGGAEKMVNNLARGFTEYGASSYLILLQSEFEYPEKVDGLFIKVLFRGPEFSGISKFFKLRLLSNRLKEILAECGYDPKSDLFTSHLPFSNYVGWIAGVKDHFAVIHSTYSKLYAKRWVYPIISLIHYKKQLVFVSKGMKLDFDENFGVNYSKSYQIYNPFNFEQIRKNSEVKVAIDEGRYLVHLGRFSQEKRHDLLLEAFVKIADENLVLLLLGDGVLKDEILSKIESLGIGDRVKLLGWVENPFPYLKKAKVSVLSSDFEGLPTGLIESLILGTPVVSTNCPSGPLEILTGELRYYLTPLNDPDLLAKNIEKALHSYPRIEDHMISKFSMRNIIIEYMKLKSNKIEI